jgi:hypothetical protein
MNNSLRESSIFKAQQTVIDDTSKELREACSALRNKQSEFETLEQTAEVKIRLAVIRNRLEALESVESKLLKPIKKEYAFIERSGGGQHPWEVYALKDRRRFVFLGSILRGL